MRRELDCVFLSYDEPLADELYQRAVSVFGRAKRVHGVHGMGRAYRLTGVVADTEHYFLVDGDFEVSRAFAVDSVPPLADDVVMRVWMARNAVNGLEYGYGGLKLCRRAAVRALPLGEHVDVLAALPGRVEFEPTTAGTTRFNQSPYHAWRAGFRECSMLARGCEYGMPSDQARSRIAIWTRVAGRGDFGEWAVRGARDGVAFARQCGDEVGRWLLINDPAWLRSRFAAAYGAASAVRQPGGRHAR
jgi:hypothetical protein